jgi:hypothetical protein
VSSISKPEILEQWEADLSAPRQELKDAEAPVPEYILEIVRCETRQVFEPSTFPYRALRFSRLADTIREVYGMRLAIKDIDTGVQEIMRRGASTEEDLGQLLLDNSMPVRFEDGFFRFPNGDACAIEFVDFQREAIHCAVKGSTAIAELLVLELVQMLWSLIDIRRSRADLLLARQVVHYGTGTRVKFGHNGDGFLAQGLLRLLHEWVDPGGLANSMGMRTSINDFRPAPRSAVTFDLESLGFSFQLQAPGIIEGTYLRLMVGARFERGSGIFIVTSELPMPEHIEAVRQLAEIA